MKLDMMDRRILDEMQKNARISNLDLADKIGLSPSPCSRRVKQLEDEGLIDRHVTLLNQAKLQLKLIALIQVSMDLHTPERFEAFEAQVRNYPEVLECYLITGQAADYLLKVIVPDMEYYQAFLLGKLTRIPGVSGVQSSFVLRKAVDTTALPLGHL
ncbi:Lrp/AsnC family transcriptional regulator [Methylovulum psychrotolerans]|jgi:Lrp/AsnC family leucine-responsive transcriptional regulator|uniref:AsnC family transcriptional regulator n=1 Tax=Methylovulum psychrotolerans TaxID=1704499 RepID=A0A1Z4BTX1_9GAMM|nr:Lrp/AsnC family transcriptional regulator [Methylovulum psychrotolerans]ASF44761.1 AsnC family transcriptional regulator [Methylovulum psychrotolerans]MBT9099780.1 Lrp/AsnC family transcriptional regulator [Methylovulum psychrotolerans]